VGAGFAAGAAVGVAALAEGQPNAIQRTQITNLIFNSISLRSAIELRHACREAAKYVPHFKLHGKSV
jgi:hypothetical protein